MRILWEKAGGSTMGMIGDKDRKTVKDRLAKLVKPVKAVVFTQEMECQFCSETRGLVQELAELSDKLKVEVRDFLGDAEEAKRLGVDKIPAIALLGEGDKDYGVRFYGIPAGYEFVSLLESLEMVSKGDSGLAPATREKLKGLKKPLHLQVFVTPTCPYCPWSPPPWWKPPSSPTWPTSTRCQGYRTR
jgi:glutaredoxin-like protein